MLNFEKLGAFFLGRRVDPASGGETEELVLYDSRDLTTHAVIIGMTGSGKTGLGVGLIEEAAMDHIPVIAIDPKGDMANLLLTFPELEGKDFRPWIDPRQATDAGQTPEQFAEAQAQLWKKGLKSWGQDGARIRKLKENAEFAVYTPGSNAATPVSVLEHFSAPDAELKADADLYRERVQVTATGLLSLLGIDADPLTSREHILIANILDHSWQLGRDLDIARLIGEIQDPPLTRIGVMDLESFYSSKDRFELAMRLNNLLAAPGFQAWMDGERLSAERFLYTEDGKPRVSVLSIAHLGEQERMFFVTMLLNEIIAWMRSQQGTSSLRAILYMDEIFGYLPPVANPPSKHLFLTLLKQARAYGLGLVLSTQNPVDLDYKALSNAGTWFIGRLQTERDKARIMEGLEGVGQGRVFDRQATEQTLAGLGKRRFLMHNVHEDEDVVFSTRWVMSYLAGPMTRDQLSRLAGDQPDPPAPDDDAPTDSGREAPLVSPDISQVFLASTAADPVYYPRLLAQVEYSHNNARYSVETGVREKLYTIELGDDVPTIDWDAAEPIPLAGDALHTSGRPDATFAECPSVLLNPKSYGDFERDFKRWFRQSETLVIYRSKAHRLSSEPGETEGQFRVRLQQLLSEERDKTIAGIRKRYASKLTTLENRLLRAQQKVETEKEQTSQRRIDTVLSVGTAILGAVLGRKRLSTTTANRVGTAIRKAGSARQQSGDLERAEEIEAKVRQDIQELDAALQAEIDALDGQYDAQTEPLTETEIRAKTTDINVKLVALAWLPYAKQDADQGDGRLKAAWQSG